MIIYKITNLLDGKIYVGQTKKTLEKRIEQHKHNKHSCIGKAIHDFGLENFSYEIIEECSSFWNVKNFGFANSTANFRTVTTKVTVVKVSEDFHQKLKILP